MIRGLNRAVLIGNVGAKPEVRTAGSGVRVATFSLATTRPRGGRGGGATDWHRIVAWEPLAAVVERHVGKGDRVYVEGRLEYRSWTDRSGRTRTTTEIVAEDLIVFDGRARGAAESL
ncbi:MAG: single-stranded DNA-binding protein [Longimicrobiales bacterium]